MEKRTKTDTSKNNRRAIANEIAEQIAAWMDIRQDHFLAEQEIGHLQSLMLCLRMGDAGRINFAERSLEHSRGLLARHPKSRTRKHGMARWIELDKSDRYGDYLVDAALYLAGNPKNDNRPDLKEMVALGKQLAKRRREYLKAMDALCDAVEAAEPLHAEVSRVLAAPEESIKT